MSEQETLKQDNFKYGILVTYGTWSNQEYAKAENIDDARKLKALAVKLGYRDARIEEINDEYYEKYFRVTKAANERGKARSQPSHRKAQ